MLRRLPAFSIAVLLSFPMFAAPRMTYDINGRPTPIEWSTASFPIRYDIDARVAQLSPSAVGMVERAFGAWETIPDAAVRFTSDGVIKAALANTPDHVAVSVADDLFRNQGAAAVTSYSYDINTGKMLDADIQIDPSLFDGSVNAEMALEHEVGHVLGLDHSAVLSSIMYPYVGAGNGPADFDVDDRITIANIYPKADRTLAGATLTGRVSGDSGGIFAAQVVAVNSAGQPVATGLTNAAGEFSLAGIPAGRYRLYAEPLDGPVESAAMQGMWRQAKTVAFPTEFFGAPIDVENGRIYGNLLLTTAGAVRLNPRWIGVAPVERADVSLSTAPATVRPGDTVNVTIGGDGFTSGMTTFEVMNPGFRRISDFAWSDNYVRATYAIDADAPNASAVVEVKSGNETAMLTGGLRVYRATAARQRAVRR